MKEQTGRQMSEVTGLDGRITSSIAVVDDLRPELVDSERIAAARHVAIYGIG
jgi:hypothetical protein